MTSFVQCHSAGRNDKDQWSTLPGYWVGDSRGDGSVDRSSGFTGYGLHWKAGLWPSRFWISGKHARIQQVDVPANSQTGSQVDKAPSDL